MMMAHLHSRRSGRAPARRRGAFTLPEMMITMTIFAMVTLGFISAHLFGLKQDQVVQSKLGSSDQARRGFDLMANDVRASKRWEVGNVPGNGNYTFTGIAEGTLQSGNALKLSLTNNWANYYYLYYFDSDNTGVSNSLKLYRSHWVNGSMTDTDLLAQYIKNSPAFRVENYSGVVQSSPSSRSVLGVQMEFYQFQYPLTKVSSNGPYMYDYYKMQFKLTSHVPN